MSALVSQLAELQADFQRIADRADWARAVFTVRAGRFGMFGIGRPESDGVDGAIINSGGGSPMFAELDVLTERAGRLALSLYGTGCFQLQGLSSTTITYSDPQPWGFWLVVLLHSPVTMGHCCVRSADGTHWFAAAEIGENEVAVWIDRYAQVCVSALAWLKGKMAAAPEAEQAHQQPPDDARPAKLLMNWREILDALELEHTEERQRQVRELNERYAGPIIFQGQGGQPKANKEKLLQWWNELERRFREAQQVRADKQATVAEQYRHGREETVVPKISGHVKKKRKSK
jgi:hypothetical protein